MNKQFIRVAKDYLLIIIGTFILAFGSVIFLAQANLVTGGLSGIAIIIQYYVGDSVNVFDYVVAGLTALSCLIGIIVIGKSFGIKSIVSSVIYIGFTFLLYRVPFFVELSKEFAGLTGGSTTPDTGNYMLCAIFGGVAVGSGVAISFLGGGSTGGVDIFPIIFKKYFRVKESITAFTVDALIIVVGMICMRNWVPALCGILSAVIAAAMIDGIYTKNQTAYQVDIISEKWQEISDYAQNVLERGATIIPAQGGYKGEDRPILRVVFDRNQYEKIRVFIAEIDPKAFVTFTSTNAVYGEGFASHKKKAKMKKK